jgi:hypothetical protein
MVQPNTCTHTHNAFELCCLRADALAFMPMQFKSFENKIQVQKYKKILSPKNSIHTTFPSDSNGPPFTTYILGRQFCTFLCYLHLQKLLLLSYVSTHFPTLFLLFLKF